MYKILTAQCIALLSSCWISATAQSFTIKHGKNVNIYLQETAAPVANTALDMLKGDMRTVLDSRLTTTADSNRADIVGVYDNTLPREGFSLNVRRGIMRISAADAHGMAYGLLEVSRLMGVSPWEWWADCTPRQLQRFVLKDGYANKQSPAVAYRGIFINDEDWGLLPWAQKREPEAWTIKQGRLKGAVGSKCTEKIFQLLLRLRANYYWPPMHECTQPFFLTAGNREVAARYGIYIGGSHCEPMACSAAAEWGIRGKGDYNYITNRKEVKQFWQKRLNEVKDQDMLYTIGMRGVHDGAMQGVKTPKEKLDALQQVIADQREMLERTKPGMADGKQLFVPYKEVLDIYNAGLKVPDDVTLMWTDDNYGYIRHFPDAKERKRAGGNGIYYHISYWGAPQDYLWLGSFSPYLLHHQMKTAYERGIRQVWVLNVGDIKPAEFLIEQWMDYAWGGFETEKNKDVVMRRMEQFYEREFGQKYGKDIASMMAEWHHLAFERRPEFMANTRVYEKDRAKWAVQRRIDDWDSNDVAERVAAYQRLSDKAELIWQGIDNDRRAAYFQMVKYQVQAAAQMNFKFLCPEKADAAYDSIAALTQTYNMGIDGKGKWQGMMDMAPRKLPVFDRLAKPLTYPQPTEKKEKVCGLVELNKGEYHCFKCRVGKNDSITLEMSFLPTFPINSDRLGFAISPSYDVEQVGEYQTKVHSEEWKQNVLRNRAVRRFTFPTNGNKIVGFQIDAVDDGLVILDIKMCEPIR